MLDRAEINYFPFSSWAAWKRKILFLCTGTELGCRGPKKKTKWQSFFSSTLKLNYGYDMMLYKTDHAGLCSRYPLAQTVVVVELNSFNERGGVRALFCWNQKIKLTNPFNWSSLGGGLWVGGKLWHLRHLFHIQRATPRHNLCAIFTLHLISARNIIIFCFKFRFRWIGGRGVHVWFYISKNWANKWRHLEAAASIRN